MNTLPKLLVAASAEDAVGRSVEVPQEAAAAGVDMNGSGAVSNHLAVAGKAAPAAPLNGVTDR